MEKQDVLNALECCISYDGFSMCSRCPYNENISENDPFTCSALLYRDVVALIGEAPAELVSVNMDKVLRDGK